MPDFPDQELFGKLYALIKDQQETINRIADKIILLEGSIGGNGGSSSSSANAVIEDYEEGKFYKRNTLVVDKSTETVYRILKDYPEGRPSSGIDNDYADHYLKLVGYESQIIASDHELTQAEINQIPDDALVAIYNRNSQAYIPTE